MQLRIDNTSGYVGVIYYKQGKSWRSRLRYKSQDIDLGHFHTREEAAYIRDQVALQLFGETAKLNIIDKDYDPTLGL